tara:strand:- start:8925 stop:11102 length:2178 start_codon:yes stop_codon:yes gene_type:complete
MADNKGDQSGLESIVFNTDTISDNAAGERMKDIVDPNQMGPQVNPMESIKNARDDVKRDIINDIQVVQEYNRLSDADDPEPDDKSMGSIRDRMEIVRAEVQTGLDHVARALDNSENAAQNLDKETEKKLVDYVKSHFDLSYDRISKRYDYWSDAEVTHDIYVPSRVVDNVRSNRGTSSSNNNNSRKGKLIDQIKTPYSRSISDTICTYNLAIFGGAPPFRIERTNLQSDRRAGRLLERRLSHNMRKIGYEQKLYQIFLDNNRYGMAPIANFYGKDGNAPVNIDPWAYFPDPRVTAQNRHEADFVGYRTWASLTALHRRGHYQNLDRLENDRPNVSWNSNQFVKETIRAQSVDPTLSGSYTSDYKNHFGLGHAHVLNTLYVFMDPHRLGIAAPFGLYRIVVANENVIIQFDPSPYPHQDIPLIHGEGMYDAHKTFASSLYDLMMPLQRYQDWLLRTRVENVQSIVQNRLVVDPNRVNIRDILDPNAARLIRTLPGANPSDAILPLTVPDATRNYFNDLDTTGQLMQRLAAANDTAQGIQSETQRTATEIARMTTLGQQRLGMQARLLSSTTMRPLVRQMIANLQFFEVDGGMVSLPEEMSADNPSGDVKYNRSEIMGEFDYVVVDGTLPTSPSENSENITRAIRTLAETGMGNSWDMDKFVERLIESFGFEDVENWKKSPSEVVPDEQIQKDLQAGNIVPMSQAAQEVGGPPQMDQEQMAAMAGQI